MTLMRATVLFAILAAAGPSVCSKSSTDSDDKSKTTSDDAAAPRWVFLADPTAYGWKELLRDGSAVWDGIKNPIAQRRRANPSDLLKNRGNNSASDRDCRKSFCARGDMIAQRVQAESFQPVPVFITVAGIYLLLTTTFTRFSAALEAKMQLSRA